MNRALIIIVLSFLAIQQAWADIVVIVNPANQDAISKADVRRMYMGKTSQFPNGIKVKAVNYDAENTIRHAFDKALLKRDSAQIQALWAKLVFTGQGVPPNVLSSSQEALEFVKANPDAIGYVSEGEVSADVKVLFKL